MKWGKQTHYCPNCGDKLYDSNITDHTRAAMCGTDCLKEWDLKYARMILGKDDEPA